MPPDTLENIQRNVATLREGLPEGAKAMPAGAPPAGGLPTPPPGPAGAAPSPPPAAPAAPPPGMGISPPPAPDDAEGKDDEEDEENAEDMEAGKAFYEGCGGKACGNCLPCIESDAQRGAVPEGGKAHDETLAVAQVGSGPLARLIEGVVKAALGPRLRRIERNLDVVAQGVDGALTLGLKSAEHLGTLRRAPAAAPRGPGVAVPNPRVSAENIHLAAPALGSEEAGKCPYDEQQLIKAINAGVLTGPEANAWLQRNIAPKRLPNPIEAVKSVL